MREKSVLKEQRKEVQQKILKGTVTTIGGESKVEHFVEAKRESFGRK